MFVNPVLLNFNRFRLINIKNCKDERGNFTDEELKAIYHDMALIRSLKPCSISSKRKVNTTEHLIIIGPAHLSIGQESAAVGMA